MNKEEIKSAVSNGRVEWLKHSFERIMERDISREIVKEVLTTGEIIEDYPDDKPYPSALFLCLIKGQPFHVVVAYDSLTRYCFVITAYQPHEGHFEPDSKTRRRYE